MRLVSLRCDSCNAQMEVDLDNLMTYCPYCGRKLQIDVEHIDEVLKEREKTKRTQEQSQENMFREQEQTKRTLMEHEYKEREDKRAHKLLLILFVMAFFACIASMYGHTIVEWIDGYKHARQNEIQISISASEANKKYYDDVVEILRSDGFENIRAVSVEDVILGLFVKEGQIKSITVNGHDDFSNGEWFPSNARIIIEYHSKK